MSTVVSVIRFVFFLLSCAGYAVFLLQKTKTRVEFIPILLFTSIICLLTLAGLLSVLPYMAALIFLGGLGLFVYYAVNKKLGLLFNRSNFHWGTVFMALWMCFILVQQRGSGLIYYDDYSHWGSVVKEMLINNSLPGARSIITIFTSYPPGSSIFIYYVCTVIGSTQSKMLIAQNLYMLAGAYALFGVADHKRFQGVGFAVCVACLYIAANHTGVLTLSVDMILPLTAVAAAAIIIRERADIKKAVLLSLPLMTATLLIKDSGVFFVMVNGLLLVYLARGQWGALPLSARRRWLYVITGLALPLLALFLWRQHVENIFGVASSRHDMSLAYFIEVYKNKDASAIRQITTAFIDINLSLKTLSTRTIIIFNGCVIALALYLKIAYKKKMRIVIKALIAANGVFLAYMAGLYGMYIFSMPTDSARALGSFARYASSVLVFLIGMLVVCLSVIIPANLAEKSAKTSKPLLNRLSNVAMHMVPLLCVLLIGHVSIGGYYKRLYTANDFPASLPGIIKSHVGDNWNTSTDERYLVFDNNRTRSGFAAFATRYMAYTSGTVSGIYEVDAETMVDILARYDFFIILDDNDALTAFMKQYVDRESYIGLYDVRETFFGAKDGP